MNEITQSIASPSSLAMIFPHSPSSSPPPSSSSADDTFDPANYPLSVDHPAPPPPDHVIPRLPPTPTLFQLYFPDLAAAASAEEEANPAAPQEETPGTYKEPELANRFRLLVTSLDNLLAEIVAPVTLDGLRTELTNMSRDDPAAAPAYVSAVRNYVVERSKRHLVWFLHTHQLQEKLDRLDRDVVSARLLVRDKEERAVVTGSPLAPLTLAELCALMPDPGTAVVAIRKHVLEMSLADLRREREKLEQEAAHDAAKVRALKAKYVEMLEKKQALEQQFRGQMRPLVQVDLAAVDEVLAQEDEMQVDDPVALPPTLS